MPKDIPPVSDVEVKQYGRSGYSGADALELARVAMLARPIEMTDEAFLTVCDRLVQGEPLVRICADTTMPSQPHFMRYLFKNPDKREIYYAAREMQMETLAEEMMLIAADDTNDFSIDPKTGRRVSHSEVVNRARIKIETLNKVMQSMAPRRFGNKNTHEISGNPDKPVTLEVVTGVPRSDSGLIKGVVAPKIIEGVAVQQSIKDV